MFKRLVWLSPLMLTGVLFTGSGAVVHAAGDWSPCLKSAKDLWLACQFDRKDDINETLASCRHIADGDARAECVAGLWEVAAEDKQACDDQRHARRMACWGLNEFRYDPDPLVNPAIDFIDPDLIPGTYGINPYVSLEAEHTYVLQAGDEGEELVVVHVTDEKRDIRGVDCRVVVDIVVEVGEDEGELEYEAVEVTDDWFAQDSTGNVYYCGEVSRNFEDGILRDLDGSFEAGIDYAKAGELVRAFPVAGDSHRQEYAPGEAEDIVKYVSTSAGPAADEGGDNPRFPCDTDMCLKTFDYTPVEPESTEYKYYLPGTGFVLAVGMEDGELTGEREELICIGDSLDVLGTPACEIEDPELLVEALCELAPATFCSD